MPAIPQRCIGQAKVREQKCAARAHMGGGGGGGGAGAGAGAGARFCSRTNCTIPSGPRPTRPPPARPPRASSPQGLQLKETLLQFSHTMVAQADLRVEAAHLARFRQNFRTVANCIVVPHPVPGT